MHLPDNVIPIRPPADDAEPGELTGEEAAAIAGRLARRRGASLLEVAVVDDQDQVIDTDPLHSKSRNFRVQAIAHFEDGHTVVGTTHPIDRVDWFSHCAIRYGSWQIIACADLVKAFQPLTDEEVRACRKP